MGATFGTVLVDTGKCSSVSHARICAPTGALGSQLDPAPLLCSGKSCIQCDLCRAGVRTAIALQPRLAGPDCTQCGARTGQRSVGRRAAAAEHRLSAGKLAVSLTLMREHAQNRAVLTPCGCPNCRQRSNGSLNQKPMPQPIQLPKSRSAASWRINRALRAVRVDLTGAEHPRKYSPRSMACLPVRCQPTRRHCTTESVGELSLLSDRRHDFEADRRRFLHNSIGDLMELWNCYGHKNCLDFRPVWTISER